MAKREASRLCSELGESLTLVPVIKRAFSVLGQDGVKNLVDEAKVEFGSHVLPNGQLRTVGGIFLQKLRQNENKAFIFKGNKSIPVLETI